MAVADLDGNNLTVVKDVGLVTNVFTDNTLKALRGDLAIGHTRYSTTGASVWANAQPVHRSTPGGGQFALAHNGNLTNTEALIERTGTLPGVVTSDSEVLAELVDQHMGTTAATGNARTGALRGVEAASSRVLADGPGEVGDGERLGVGPRCGWRRAGSAARDAWWR